MMIHQLLPWIKTAKTIKILIIVQKMIMKIIVRTYIINDTHNNFNNSHSDENIV